MVITIILVIIAITILVMIILSNSSVINFLIKPIMKVVRIVMISFNRVIGREINAKTVEINEKIMQINKQNTNAIPKKASISSLDEQM